MNFICICATLVILMLIIYTLDYIAAIIRSHALHGLAVHAIQCKVVLLVLELFSFLLFKRLM